MELTPKKIMDALQGGLSQQEMVSRFPGETLSPDEMEDLFTKAKLLGRSQIAHRLLVYLIQVSTDDWFNVRVLALLVQHADSAQDQTGRLVAMRKILDRLVKTLPDTGDQFVHYQKLNAFYYVLAARSRRDVGDMDRALAWYETGLGIYKSLGLEPSAEKVVQEIQSLHVERRAFALTSANREAAPGSPAAASESTEEADEPMAEEAQPAAEVDEPEPVEAQPAAAEVEPLPAEAHFAEDLATPEAIAPAAPEPQPEPEIQEPALESAAPVPTEVQPEVPSIQPVIQPSSLAGETDFSAADDAGTLGNEIQALRLQRDALQIEVQDVSQQCDSLQSQASKTKKQLKGLETRVKEQQRILEEKQALIQQMDRLSEQEVRLRQTLAQLEQQEQDQTRKLEALYNEARLLEKQVDVLKRHTAPPLIPAESGSG